MSGVSAEDVISLGTTLGTHQQVCDGECNNKPSCKSFSVRTIGSKTIHPLTLHSAQCQETVQLIGDPNCGSWQCSALWNM